MSTWHAITTWFSGGLLVAGVCAPRHAMAAEAAASSSPVLAAAQLTNTLGMRFVQIPDTPSWISIWETRYSAYDGNDMALSALEGDGFGNIVVAGYIRGCAT